MTLHITIDDQDVAVTDGGGEKIPLIEGLELTADGRRRAWVVNLDGAAGVMAVLRDHGFDVGLASLGRRP